MPKRLILVVDDEEGARFGIREFLVAHGFEVDEAASCAVADELFRTRSPDAVVLDFQLPDGTALDLIPRLRAMDPAVPVLILTAYGTIERAVESIQGGADQFLTKPVELPALLTVLERLLADRRMRQRQSARRAREDAAAQDPFLGTSAAIHHLADEARRALASESPIFIQGETGSGKGVLAAWLHRNGTRADEPFVDLNCAGLSRELLESELFGHDRGAFTDATTSKPGLLEVAHHGVVFLDEVGDMDTAVQAKLLKVIEEKRFRRLGEVRDRRVDIQLVAATHQDLSALVREKRFREDLYYRLHVLSLRIPPLRERVEDIPIIACRLLAMLAAELGRTGISLSPDADARLTAHPWPGNVRELRNVLERAVLRCDGPMIAARHILLDGPLADGAPPPEADLTLEEAEHRHIARALAAEGGHVERAARRLGVPRSSLYERIKRLGLTPPY